MKVKFDSIEHLDIKPSGNGPLPIVVITLTNGKTGEFGLAIVGSFKGQSGFGEMEFAATETRRVVFK